MSPISVFLSQGDGQAFHINNKKGQWEMIATNVAPDC